MKKAIFISIIVVFIFLLGIQQYLIRNSPPKQEDILLKKITEIELKIDSLSKYKDSIRTVIDSTHVKIVTNEKHYQERVNTIITQPLSLDSQYISDYIGRYIESHKSYFQRTRETE